MESTPKESGSLSPLTLESSPKGPTYALLSAFEVWTRN